MEQNNKKSVMTYLPSGRQVMIHFVILFAFSCLLGPLIGPWLINWINPPRAWGIAAGIGDYTPMNVLLWGLAFLMIEVFFYTGWLIARARKGWKKEQPKSWYN